ncbi:hypothetical protein M0805_003760 [Coniferiporia weirii]|nr:hypothetical protein M0805_003760 [Coniferiporia weirii]
MLQKLNKKDPFSPHSYRPITLEETLGNLLKKMIANQLQFLANEEDWLPPNQYGGRQGHSVYDTAQHLLQLAEGAHAMNQVCSILALLTMGCLPNMADWCLSFMTGCKVAISFDGTTTPLTPKPDLGTPQGSPTSPILSTIFAGLVLCCFQWRGCKLLAYVDDHLIVCVSASVTANCKTLTDAYQHLNGLFNRLGLNIEAAKTEALHFHPPVTKPAIMAGTQWGSKLMPTPLSGPLFPCIGLGFGGTRASPSSPMLSACAPRVSPHSLPYASLAILSAASQPSTSNNCTPHVCTLCSHGAHQFGTMARVPHVQQVPAYTHTPWVDPLAFGQGRISFSIPPVPVPSEVQTDFVHRAWELCMPHSVQVFTNGSHLGQKAGSAIIAMCGPQQLNSHRLTSPLCTTATDAEQFSLGIAPGWAARHLHDKLVHVSDIVFMSDSLTALNLYKHWPSASGANLLPLWKSGIQTLLDSFPQLHIHFAWSLGHEDIAGNEWADAEAKAATRLPPSNLPPSISMLKEQATLTARERWSLQLARPLTSTADKYFTVTGPPTWSPQKLLMLLVDHPRHELSAVAQVLCCAGPYRGYWLSFDSAYRHTHGLISYCRWHNHPPWPTQSTAHILGGCKSFAQWIPRIWPRRRPPPVHHSEWVDEDLILVLRHWVRLTGHLHCILDHTVGAIHLAFAAMALDGHPTTNSLDMNTLRAYVHQYLGPRTQDTDLALLELSGNVPPFPPDSHQSTYNLGIEGQDLSLPAPFTWTGTVQTPTIVEHAHLKGLVCSILVVDIQGFFDSVHPPLLHQQLMSMGCPLNMADWCLSFMMGQSVSISFDGMTLPTTPKPDLSTPQGSLVSPILSTIFAGLALWRFQQPSCNLLTYVDDHLIVCVGPDIASNCDKLATTHQQLDGHFQRLSLNIKAAKTEALHFHPPWRTIGYDNWHTTGIQITPTTIIKPTNPLRWLRIWWDPGLSFKAHVEHMCSKGLSTLAALRILRNTECGILALLLRQLYSACIHTVLAWGSPVCANLPFSHSLQVRVPHVQQVPMYTHPPWTDPLAFGQGQITFEVPPIPVPSELLPTWKAGVQTLLDSFPGLSVHFTWCPGHSDIPGNEWADAEAKAATDLPPSSLAPSISTLKEQSTLVMQARWAHQLRCPLASMADKYLAVTGPPTCTLCKLLMLFVDHPCHELSTVAQVLCRTGPYRGYWLSFDPAYRCVHSLIPYCWWHNHPPWPIQSTTHILGSCDAFQVWIPQVWLANRPPPAHHSEWADETLLPVLWRWLCVTGHLNRISDCTTGSIRLAFATMDLDDLPTSGVDFDLNVLRDYVGDISHQVSSLATRPTPCPQQAAKSTAPTNVGGTPPTNVAPAPIAGAPLSYAQSTAQPAAPTNPSQVTTIAQAKKKKKSKHQLPPPPKMFAKDPTLVLSPGIHHCRMEHCLSGSILTQRAHEFFDELPTADQVTVLSSAFNVKGNIVTVFTHHPSNLMPTTETIIDRHSVTFAHYMHDQCLLAGTLVPTGFTLSPSRVRQRSALHISMVPTMDLFSLEAPPSASWSRPFVLASLSASAAKHWAMVPEAAKPQQCALSVQAITTPLTTANHVWTAPQRPMSPTIATTPATAATAEATTRPLSPPALRNAASTASSPGKSKTSLSSLKKKNSNEYTITWNAAHSLAAIQSLFPFLSSAPSPPHLLLIQEPLWYQIGSQPSLTDPAGLPIYGVPSISGYVTILPPDMHPHIVTYVSLNLPSPSWSVIGPATSGTDVLTVEVCTQVTIQVCNYYSMSPPDHDAPSPQYPGCPLPPPKLSQHRSSASPAAHQAALSSPMAPLTSQCPASTPLSPPRQPSATPLGTAFELYQPLSVSSAGAPLPYAASEPEPHDYDAEIAAMEEDGPHTPESQIGKCSANTLTPLHPS